MTIIARVSPTGLMVETGAVSRVTPRGFIRETAGPTGVAVTPLSVYGSPGISARVTPWGFVVETGIGSAPTPSGFIVETQVGAPGGLWVANVLPDIAAAEADNSDATYAETPAPSVCILRLRPVTAPGVTSGHYIHYRGSSPSGNQLKMSLYDGPPGGLTSVLIAEWTQTLTASNTDYYHALSGAEAGNIRPSSYVLGNLYLRQEAL